MGEEKLPPHDIGAEESVLGAVLIDGDMIGHLSSLSVDDFYLPEHQGIWKAMMNLRKSEAAIDEITVAHELRRMEMLEQIGGSSYLVHLVAGTVLPSHATHYTKVIKDCALNRAIIASAGQIAAMGYGGGDPAGNLASSWEILRKVGRMLTNTQLLTPRAIAERADSRYASLREVEPGLLTGVRGFDRLTGGISNGDYVILASRPGMGKTTFALQMAQCIARERNALFISLEMMPDAIIDKIVASLVLKPVRLIRKGNYPQELLTEIYKTLGPLSEMHLYLCHGPATTASLRQVIEQVQVNYGLDIVFLDYLHLLRDRYGSNTNERIGFISGELASISKEFNIPLIVLSQLSRAPDDRVDRRPHLSDLRESGSLEQDADLILFLYRDSYYDHAIDADGAETELIIAKDRLRGVTGKLKLYWDSEKERYNEEKRTAADRATNTEPAAQQMGMV